MKWKNYTFILIGILAILLLIGGVEKCRKRNVHSNTSDKEKKIDKPIMNVETKTIDETPEQKRAGYLSELEDIRKRIVLMDDADNKFSKDEVSDIANVFSNISSSLLILQRNQDSVVSKKASELIGDLKAKQKKAFPVLRKNYIKWANNDAWENDMKVKGYQTPSATKWA